MLKISTKIKIKRAFMKLVFPALYMGFNDKKGLTCLKSLLKEIFDCLVHSKQCMMNANLTRPHYKNMHKSKS